MYLRPVIMMLVQTFNSIFVIYGFSQQDLDNKCYSEPAVQLLCVPGVRAERRRAVSCRFHVRANEPTTCCFLMRLRQPVEPHDERIKAQTQTHNISPATATPLNLTRNTRTRCEYKIPK